MRKHFTPFLAAAVALVASSEGTQASAVDIEKFNNVAKGNIEIVTVYKLLSYAMQSVLNHKDADAKIYAQNMVGFLHREISYYGCCRLMLHFDPENFGQGAITPSYVKTVNKLSDTITKASAGEITCTSFDELLETITCFHTFQSPRPKSMVHSHPFMP